MGRPKAASDKPLNIKQLSSKQIDVFKTHTKAPKAPEVRRYQQVGVHVLPNIAEGLAEIAETRSTNVSQLCRQILTDYVRDHARKPVL